MAGLRERIRTSIPGSTEVYEHLQHVRRRRASLAQLKTLKASGAPIKLDIGGGGRPGTNGWITVDTAEGCDLYWDLREGIPFANGTVEAIYSSHMLEHLTFDDGQALLRECYRALKPGGSISVVVPNARLYIEGYLGAREIPQEFFGWAPAYNGTTGIDAVNYVAYMGGEHKYMFDEENLIHRLRAAGFADARRRSFDPSLDLAERDYESVYAEGHRLS
jgi:predicted SAM-dependent methyltransferase